MRDSSILTTLLFVVASWAAADVASAQGVVSFTVTGDAIIEPLEGLNGDPQRGRTVLLDPERGNCTICHPVPGVDSRSHGTVGPPLAGAGSRLTAGQMRLRLVDSTRINSLTVMPAYHRIEGLNKVGAKWQGKPILGAQDIEDVIAFLITLKN